MKLKEGIMKQMSLVHKLTALSLLVLLAATGCSRTAAADGEDLMKEISPEKVEVLDAYNEESLLSAADFSVELFKANSGNENTLISPISVLSALGMTSNGAEENTLMQMEEVFGLSRNELNMLLELYIRSLPRKDNLKVSMANSIWFREGERLNVRREFLQTNANYYDAGIYRAAFDEKTLKAINTWVEKETDGMIKDILDKIPEEAMMYLINALSFDAKWETIYNENEISEDQFTAEDGSMQTVDMMFSTESLYVRDDQAKGVIKNYSGGKYAFMALLPDENVSVQEYITSLTGEKLHTLIKEAENTPVFTMIPKFESSYSVEMSEILKGMGMTDAFDEKKADFNGLGTSPEGNLYISRVIHKTKIAVDEKGTKAGAATVVEVVTESAAPVETKEVLLNRPFVYMIIDKETSLPLFMGTLRSVE